MWRIRSRRLLLAGRIGFGLMGLTFLALAFLGTIDEARGRLLPGWSAVAAATSLVLTGLACAWLGWASLLPRRPPGALARPFFLSQLGKYVPGMIWQPLGQVGMTAALGIPSGEAAVAFLVHTVTQLASAVTVGVGVSFLATEAPIPLRLASLAALPALVLLRRDLLLRLLGLVWRRERGGTLPSQPAIFRAYAWAVATMVLAGLSFALLCRSLRLPDDLGAFTASFSFAWAVGFVALPFPSGIGIREAVLVALLPGPTAAIISAGLVHRLVVMALEGLIGGVSAIERRAPGRRTRETG